MDGELCAGVGAGAEIDGKPDVEQAGVAERDVQPERHDDVNCRQRADMNQVGVVAENDGVSGQQHQQQGGGSDPTVVERLHDAGAEPWTAPVENAKCHHGRKEGNEEP